MGFCRRVDAATERVAPESSTGAPNAYIAIQAPIQRACLGPPRRTAAGYLPALVWGWKKTPQTIRLRKIARVAGGVPGGASGPDRSPGVSRVERAPGGRRSTRGRPSGTGKVQKTLPFCGTRLWRPTVARLEGPAPRGPGNLGERAILGGALALRSGGNSETDASRTRGGTYHF